MQPFLLNNNGEKNLQINNIFHPGDTAQIKLLIKSGNRMLKSAPDSAIVPFKKALQLSREMGYSQGIAVSLLSMGSYFYIYRSNYRQARIYFDRAVPYCQLASAENKRILPGVYGSIANIYFQEGKYDSAIHFYYKALEIIKSRPQLDTQFLIQYYTNIGAVIGTMDQYDRALQYLQKARQWWDLYKKDTFALATIYQNMGGLLYKQKNIDSAIQLYNNVLRLYQDMHSKNGIQNAYNYIATLWLYQNNIKKAKRYFDSAVNADPEGTESNWMLLQNMGCVYYYSGNFKKAIPYYI